MIELVGCLPSLHMYISKDLNWIKEQLSFGKDEVRECAALLYGIVLSLSASDAEFNDAVKNLLNDTSHKNLEIQHGSILAVGYCLEIKALHQKFDDIHMELVKSSIETLGKYSLIFECPFSITLVKFWIRKIEIRELVRAVQI